MKKIILFLLLIFSLIVFSSNYEKTAMDYLSYLKNGEFEKAVEISTEIMKKQANAQNLENIWNKIISTYGIFEQILKLDFQKVGKYEVYTFTVNFEKAKLAIIISVDDEGKVAGLFFNTPKEYTYSDPEYVNKSLFEEKDIEINSLPGKITIPKNGEKFPAVILIHGSGPNDMDETIGPNKIFKDIAGGLSSNGIVVLRYNKRTMYPEKLSSDITVKEEVIDDVIAAIEYLKSQKYVNKIYLLGHSLGAFLAPYIATSNNAIDGLILLGTPARNLEDVIIDQLVFLKNFYNEDYSSLIDKIKKLKNNELDENEILLGASAKYYYDLRNYNPQNYLKKYKKPVLMLFGGNDYQTSIKEYEKFKEILSNKDNIKIILYENLTHLFTEGEKSPYIYLKEAHVSKKVIEDIINWIKKGGYYDNNNN
ncbi:MAG: dienelactone hydrolase family protein [Thermosipho sp. (in: Bacteria)]|nr:dienelactone hydrolase family protein [Thermosipho sp. (in: thermotogales)]